RGCTFQTGPFSRRFSRNSPCDCDKRSPDGGQPVVISARPTRTATTRHGYKDYKRDPKKSRPVSPISLRLSGFSLASASRLPRLSRLADVEARDQAILDPKDVTDHLVDQHLSLEVAHRLVDLDDDLTIGAG